jgi:hypothetical protein
MDKKLNETLTVNILKSIPQNIKPIDFLIDILEISRESVYRRIRGDIAFSFEEISKLSLKLGFSLDEIIESNTDERVFLALRTNNLTPNPDESLLSLFQEYYKNVEAITKYKDTEVLISINRLYLLFVISSEILFKVFYYKWLHGVQATTPICPFAELVIPPQINILRQKIRAKIAHIRNVTFVLDRNLFANLIREVQYYYNRKLITDEEIVLIKKEAKDYLDRFEKIILHGKNEHGSNYNFYLSLLDVASTNLVVKYGENMISQYWFCSISHLIITNRKICEMQRQWIESLKKHSVLITQSNEILQVSFINKQREYVENITKELHY